MRKTKTAHPRHGAGRSARDRGTVLWTSVLRNAAAGAILWSATSGASAEPLPDRVLVLPVKLLDTSNEPEDQTSAHADRLAKMTDRLTDDLTGTGFYKAVAISPETLRRACPSETAACLLDVARTRSARFVFIGVVHKSSSLIMQMWARLVDVRTGTDIFSRDLNFRGDTDEAWRRAEAFLIAQIEAAQSGGEAASADRGNVSGAD